MQFARHPKTIALSLVLSIISFFTAWVSVGIVSDFFLNVSASFVTVLFTVIFIDSLLERERARRYREAFRVAREDLKQMLAALDYEFSVPFGGDAENFISALSTTHLERKLEHFTDSNWLELSINLPFMVDEVSNRVNEYAKLLPPEMLGKLYALERSLKRMRASFVAYGEDMVERRAPHTEFAEKYARDIATFISAHKSLDEALEGWQ